MQQIVIEAVDPTGKRHQKHFVDYELDRVRFLSGSTQDKCEIRLELIKDCVKKTKLFLKENVIGRMALVSQYYLIIPSKMNNFELENTDYDVSDIISILKNKRFDLSNEKRLQAQISSVFVSMDIKHRREYWLDPAVKSSKIDFLVEGLGIEIKIKGSKKEIYRQLERYASYEEIKRIVLVTSLSMTLPETINNKPTHICNLSASWL